MNDFFNGRLDTCEVKAVRAEKSHDGCNSGGDAGNRETVAKRGPKLTLRQCRGVVFKTQGTAFCQNGLEKHAAQRIEQNRRQCQRNQ